MTQAADTPPERGIPTREVGMTSQEREDRPIRVLINALHAKSGGGITYLRNIVPELACDPRLELHLFLHVDQCGLFLPVDERVRLHVLDFRPGFWNLLIWEQLSLPVVARVMSADVTFSPANFGPLLAPRSVVLLRNAVAVAGSEPRLAKRVYWAGLALMTAVSLLAARRAIAVSDYARGALTFGMKRLAARKVSVVHHGVDPRFTPGETAGGDGPSFLLAVSDLYIQKNLHTLVRALPAIRAAHPDIVLKIAGRAIDRDYADLLEALVAREGLADCVEFLGEQPMDRLIALYRQCAVFVFPSTVETFGNPLAEAMACGAAIACSNSSAMPEVAANAARLFDPNDPADMAAHINAILGNEAAAQTLRESARRRGREFSWQRAAQQTADVLIDAAGGRAAAARLLADREGA